MMKCGLSVVQCDAIRILVGTAGVWHPMCDFIASDYTLWGVQTNPSIFSSELGQDVSLPTYVCGECRQPAFRALKEAFQANKMGLNRELGLLSKPSALHKTGLKLPLYLFH